MLRWQGAPMLVHLSTDVVATVGDFRQVDGGSLPPRMTRFTSATGAWIGIRATNVSTSAVEVASV